jgi:hypothetical protein
MADLKLNLNQSVLPSVIQRTVLLGRVKMAQAIRRTEPEWAKILSEVEKDPLFQDLLSASVGQDRIIRYKRYGKSAMSGQFYEMQDERVVGGSGHSPETLLDRKKHLLALIQRIGQPQFEKYFLYREEALPIDQIAQRCGMSLAEANELNEFIVDMSVEAEFYHPSGLQPHTVAQPNLIGRIVRNEDKSYSVAFYSPHLARGLYEINHDALKKWQKEKSLDRTDSARIRRFLGILELSNLKQGAFWRVIEYLLVAQKDYLDTQDPSKMAPISLRHVARHLQFAPSTISRVMGSKSILLPWDREVMLTHLMPGQRRVVLSILDRMLTDNPGRVTDARLATQIEESFGVKVSRRTITACRHILIADKAKQA